jgi:hypothetical protein
MSQVDRAQIGAEIGVPNRLRYTGAIVHVMEAAMARARKVSPDFWTWQEVVACTMTSRLLFIGLWNFADDFGVQPLKTDTIRMQVFPGDPLDADQVREMIDELAARELVRIYAVDGREYLEIVDWQQLHRVGKRARRRYPGRPAHEGRAETGLTATTPDHSEPLQSPSARDGKGDGLTAPAPTPEHRTPLQNPSVALRPRLSGEMDNAWQRAIEARLRSRWPKAHPLEGDTALCISTWIDEGCALEPDVLSALDALRAPPAALNVLARQVLINRDRRLAAHA